MFVYVGAITAIPHSPRPPLYLPRRRYRVKATWAMRMKVSQSSNWTCTPGS